VSYFSYWTQKLIEVIRECSDGTVTIQKLAETTAIKHQDIMKVLEDLNLIRYTQGQHIIISDKALLDALYKKAGRAGYPLDPDKLIWVPYKLRYEI
jgi:histone acetyltransferase HTATIP